MAVAAQVCVAEGKVAVELTEPGPTPGTLSSTIEIKALSCARLVKPLPAVIEPDPNDVSLNKATTRSVQPVVVILPVLIALVLIGG